MNSNISTLAVPKVRARYYSDNMIDLQEKCDHSDSECLSSNYDARSQNDSGNFKLKSWLKKSPSVHKRVIFKFNNEISRKETGSIPSFKTIDTSEEKTIFSKSVKIQNCKPLIWKQKISAKFIRKGNYSETELPSRQKIIVLSRRSKKALSELKELSDSHFITVGNFSPHQKNQDGTEPAGALKESPNYKPSLSAQLKQQRRLRIRKSFIKSLHS